MSRIRTTRRTWSQSVCPLHVVPFAHLAVIPRRVERVNAALSGRLPNQVVACLIRGCDGLGRLEPDRLLLPRVDMVPSPREFRVHRIDSLTRERRFHSEKRVEYGWERPDGEKACRNLGCRR